MVAVATQYRIDIFNPSGVQLLSFARNQIFGVDWVLKTNAVGVLRLELPYQFLTYFATDTRIALYRSVAGGNYYLEGDTIFFVRKIGRTLSAAGELRLAIEAYSAAQLLDRRIVDYASGSAQASKTSVALDDMAKSVVYENFSTGATDVTRRLPTTLFTIDPNLTAAPVGSKAFSRRRVLTVCQEIAQDSTTSGTYLAFDVVWNGSVFVFRTFTGGRGPDNTRTSGSNPVIFNPQYGNLSDVSLTDDFTAEYNYVVSAGQGLGAARATALAKDDARIAASPFNRCEYNDDSRDVSDAGQLQSEADSSLRENRPKRLFNAKVLQTSTSLYGRDYQFGSKVTAEFFLDAFDCRIETISGSMKGGQEEIQVQLQAVGF